MIFISNYYLYSIAIIINGKLNKHIKLFYLDPLRLIVCIVNILIMIRLDLRYYFIIIASLQHDEVLPFLHYLFYVVMISLLCYHQQCCFLKLSYSTLSVSVK
jgi:hypothetical protein